MAASVLSAQGGSLSVQAFCLSCGAIWFPMQENLVRSLRGAQGEETLHASEKAGDVKAADSAAATLAVVEGNLIRFRARRLAVTEGLAEARAAKTAAEKAARIATLQAAQARAAKDADAAQEKAVTLISSLGDTLLEYFAAAKIENGSADELAREGGDGSVPGTGGRFLGRIEEAAKASRSYSERV